MAYNLFNPTLNESLDQNQKAGKEIARSSQDNLVAVAGNTALATDMSVPPPFVPPGSNVGVGARSKNSLTVTRPTMEETDIETDDPIAPVVHARPCVQSPTLAKPMAVNTLVMVGDDGLNIWADKMLSGHPADQPTGNSGEILFSNSSVVLSTP